MIHFRNNHTTATSYKHQIMRDQVCKTAEALAKAKLARTLRFALAADPISAMMRTSRSLPVTTQLVQVRGPQGCYSRVPEVVSVVCVWKEAANGVVSVLRFVLLLHMHVSRQVLTANAPSASNTLLYGHPCVHTHPDLELEHFQHEHVTQLQTYLVAPRLQSVCFALVSACTRTFNQYCDIWAMVV